jgi:N-formylglutamate amidohydrolase
VLPTYRPDVLALLSTERKEFDMTQFTYDTDLFSDLHKDANGFRPNGGHEFYRATPERKQEIWDFYQAMVAEEIERTRREEEASADAFEAQITNMISLGAGDRKTAIRWLVMSDINLSANVKAGVAADMIADEMAFNYHLAYDSALVNEIKEVVAEYQSA